MQKNNPGTTLQAKMSADRTPGMADGYSQRNFDTGPKTYRDPSFNELILKALKIDQLQPRSRVMDLMSGPGKLGMAIEAAVPAQDHNFVYLDFVQTNLDKIPDASHRLKICSDIRTARLEPNSFDRIVTRYALKDIPQTDQFDVVSAAATALKPGGVFVLADMVLPNLDPQHDSYDWLNTQHSMKQIQNGREAENEGECHIRTLQGWQELLSKSGLQPEVTGAHTSKVTTTEWLKSGQVSEPQLAILNRFILSAPDTYQWLLNIRQDQEGVKIDFPVTVISAQKPNTK